MFALSEMTEEMIYLPAFCRKPDTSERDVPFGVQSYRRKFHEYGVLALPAGGEQQCYYKQGRLHPAHSGPPMDSALHVLCEVRDDILCCIENLAQKITYECPEYSISSWTSARLPLRLTDEGGPGAG